MLFIHISKKKHIFRGSIQTNGDVSLNTSCSDKYNFSYILLYGVIIYIGVPKLVIFIYGLKGVIRIHQSTYTSINSIHILPSRRLLNYC